MRLLTYSLLLSCLYFLTNTARGQNVNVTATQGTASASYPTLGQAFDAINAAVHRGNIKVTVVNNTTETPFGAILQFSGYALLTDYTKVTITTNGNWTVSGNVAPGQSVIQLNGCDNVTINGTTNNGTGGTRNLTIANTSSSTNTGVLWLKSSGLNSGCSRDSIINLNMIGATGGNISNFGIFAAGSVISTTGAGADHDTVVVKNNLIYRTATGIYYRSNSSGPSENITIINNIIGSPASGQEVYYRGLDLQYIENSQFTGNEVRYMKQSGSNHISGFEIGNGVTNCTFQRNNIHDLVNTSPTFYGAYGISMGGSANIVVNNQVYRIIAGSNSISSTAFNGFGIRVNAGSGHKFYHNSVHMYDTVSIAGANPAMSAAFCITTTPMPNLDVRNNIFSNKMVGRVNNSRFYAVFVPNGYSWIGSTIDNNAYFVNPVNTALSLYYVGSNLGFNHTNLSDWSGYTQQDSSSVPSTHQFAPFLNDTNLHINTSLAPLVIESGSVYLASYQYDYDNQIRQGHPGYSQNPAGTAPDIGMDEVATTPPDIWGPVIDSVWITPAGGGCTAVPHQIEAIISDTSGVDTAMISWSLNGQQQNNLTMVNLGGSWAGVIPAQPGGYVTYRVIAIDNSLNANTGSSITFGYQDEYLSADAGQDVIICTGDSTTLVGSTQFDGTPKITELTLDRAGSGATPSYPAYATGADLVEISNIGNVPVNLAGYSLHVRGGATANITFGSGVILEDSAILIVHVGPGTDDPANLYFNTGGLTNDLQSGEATGVWLVAPNGRIVDAIAANGFTFTPSTGVLASDWAGNMTSSLGAAGLSRNGADSNGPSGWAISSPGVPQSIGALNNGVPFNTSVTYFWSPGAITQPSITVNPTGPSQYIFTVLDGSCTRSDTVVVDVLPIPIAPTMYHDTVCGLDSIFLHGTGQNTLHWFATPTSQVYFHTGDTFSYLAFFQDTFYVEDFNGGCGGPRVQVIGRYDPPPAITLNASSPSVCSQDSVVLSVSSGNSAYSFSWTGQVLLQTTGDTVTGYPNSTSWYVVTAQDSVCTNKDSLEITVYQPPFATINASDTLICIGDSAIMMPALTQYFTQVVAFNDSTVVPIPDNNSTGAISTINVSGLNHTVMNDTSILWVCLNIQHARDGDITGYLISPAGDSIRLFANLGINAPNYTSTCFSPSATTNIFLTVAPFTGIWFPQGPGTFSDYNGSNPNGTWTLRVIDNLPGNTGSILNWSMTFQDVNPVSYDWTAVPSGYQWNSYSIVDSPTVTTDYFLTVTDTVSGCFHQSNYQLQVADPLDAIIIAPPGICLNATDTLFANASGGDGNYLFTWNPGAVMSDSFSLTLTNDTTIYLYVVDGCGSPADSDSVFIPIAGQIVATATNDTTVCPGIPLSLTVNTSGGDGNFLYSWSSGSQLQNEVVTPIMAQWITVLVTDGCGATDSDSVHVDLFTAPSVSAPNDTTICEGVPITIIATYSASALPVSFSWGSFASTSDTLVDTPTVSRVYRVTIQDNCGNVDQDTMQVNVDPLPLAQYVFMVQAGGVVQFTNASSNATSYSWSFGDTQTSTSANPAHTYSASGNYSVRLIATNSCGNDTITQMVNVVITGSEPEAGGHSFSISPNPNRGQFVVRFDSESNEPWEIRILNIQGTVLRELKGVSQSGQFEKDLDLTDFARGVYFLELKSSSYSGKTKMIIQ